MKPFIRIAAVIFSFLHVHHFVSHNTSRLTAASVPWINFSVPSRSTGETAQTRHGSANATTTPSLPREHRSLKDKLANYSNFRRRYPKIQVALTTSAGGVDYAMRFWANALENGWHKDFGYIPIYTFDNIPAKSPMSKLYTQVQPLFEKEKTKKNNNLLLAAIEEIYYYNPHADWYLLAEDDTIIIKENLLHAIKAFNLDPNKEFMGGNCAGATSSYINGTNLPVGFVIGGAGTLMSRALVKAMVPYIPICRKTMNDVPYGDMRIGGCLLYQMNRRSIVKGEATLSLEDLGTCQIGNKYQIISREITSALDKWGRDPRMRNQRIIALHEKNIDSIQALNDWISARSGEDITLANIMRDLRLVALLSRKE